MINHGTYENLPVMDLMACRCTLCCETPGHYLPHMPREAALLCLEWLHKSCNLIFLLRFCLCFRSPPPRASDQLLRPRPDQGRGERHDQRGGHRLSDVSRPPVNTPGNPGGEVGCREENFKFKPIFTSLSQNSQSISHQSRDPKSNPRIPGLVHIDYRSS